ncbi:fructose PTS transporter subunit IIB, partial [Deinococcus sp.]|uniref:fructose PTS transporter subunit IIB n=1 Tax=Deinococcus sp. TaxID=47478 RepID=UPI00391A3F15
MIAAPDGADQAHLKILSALATSLINDEFLADLRSADSEQRVVDLVAEAVQPAPVTANAGGRSSSSNTAASTAGIGDTTEQTTTTVGRLVAVTACPTGIAHTYMAADSLKKAAKEAGVEIQVETQGSSGATPLGADTIAAADAVIFATDVDVRDRHRFAGKPVIT